jgi:hypothetical protein
LPAAGEHLQEDLRRAGAVEQRFEELLPRLTSVPLSSFTFSGSACAVKRFASSRFASASLPQASLVCSANALSPLGDQPGARCSLPARR